MHICGALYDYDFITVNCIVAVYVFITVYDEDDSVRLG